MIFGIFEKAHQFYPLVQINCSKDLRFLLCSIYTPICIKGYPHFLPPCRSICQRVKAGCSPIMEHYEFPWPERMNCEQFPEYNNPQGILCMERNLTHEEQLELQSINIKNYQSIQSINQSSINQLNELSNSIQGISDPLGTSNSLGTEKYDQIKTLSIEDIELKNQFNDDASYILFKEAIKNDNISQLKTTFPNLHLKCTCDCRPPLINIKNLGMNSHEKITVADIKDCSMPCYTPYYPINSSYHFTTFWLGIWSIFCAISTLITIFTFIIDSYRFQYPELPLIYLSLCYFMISMGYLIRVFMGHQAIACDSLPNQYENLQNDLTQTTMNNNHNHDWFGYNPTNIHENLKSVTIYPDTITTTTTVAKATMTTNELSMITSKTTSNLLKSPNQLIRSKILRYALNGRASCAVVFLLIYFFNMAASIWWVILALTWLLAAGLKWGSEAISKYSQVFHFIAWSLPASQTALALLLSIVEGDPISGLCTIQSNKSIPFLLFTFIPLLIYLIIGILFMMIGFIALFHIRGTIKLQRPRIIEIHKLDKLIIRIGIYGMLYTIPNLIVLFIIGYELRNTYIWQLGIACHCHYDIGQYNEEVEPILPVALPIWNPSKPEYSIYMLKHFMTLMIGIISGFWIWSNKTIDTWRRFCFNGNKCLFQFNKHNNSSSCNGLLVNPNCIEQDIYHKRRMKHWIQIPSNVSMATVTKSYVTQLSGHSMNPSFSTLSSSLNSPHKSSMLHLNNNNNNNSSLNITNNHSSISTGISSSGISSGQINDGLTRTGSIFTGSELNSNSISPKNMDYYLNGEQRSFKLNGSQATTTTTTPATTLLPVINYDRHIDESNLRRNNHSICVNNQFISNMINENRKNCTISFE
ncbi:frizzled, putative [Schistosoma mansoni]|uniref:frizzled, putative n=1 Tax=Schistosoma mansoni TaxID=6183 RepID=UPI0001A637EC|nr:frizzled, putative [Schistosoma mansoni]|eukprot:XP_018644984.1 frizzled, putative [Schistosoma mansoni]